MEVNTFPAIKDRLDCSDTIDEQRKYVPMIILFRHFSLN